jgi:hypothetical protein
MSLLDNPADTIYVSGSIFDTETVITISDELLSNVFSVNGQVGNVIINTGSFITGVDLSSYATITNLALTGSALQSQINNLDLNYASDLQLSQTGSALNTKIDNLSGVSVLTYGNQTISGSKNFVIRPTVNGTGVLLSGEAINLAADIGIYNYKANTNYENQYSKQEFTINAREQTSPVSGIKNDDIVNLYFSHSDAGLTDPIDNGVNNTTYSRTLKVNPGILVDHNGAASSRNLIKFDDATQYSGKAIRKVRYNSTIGNGYERILLSADSDDVDNCPIIRPKTRRIETFYDINVPSGGGTTRYFLFRTPTSFPFAQAACMNLRFNFEADSSPCVISGLVYGTNEHVLTLSGANYSFVQKERVILISKGEGGNTAEFKHW